jgi:glyoxylase-like metal-dependent hydrolase (beta-lactamase superfamily II)
MSDVTAIKALQLEMNAGGHPFVVHASLLWDANETILIDTGIAGQLQVIREAMAEASVPVERLTKIIITHQDRDHIGSLPDLVDLLNGRVQVLAHDLSKPYIEGEKPLLKSGTMATPCKVDVTLQDGDIIPFAGGIQVIFTPGHTDDHISLYHQPSKTLISGDALTSQNGVLMPPDPNFTPDMDTALKSVAKLLPFDIETVITYHGGVVTERIKERLTEISEGK